LCGEETVIDRASIVPLEVLVPTADAHVPVTSAEEVALVVVEKVVADVVFTVVVPEPKRDVTTNDEPEIEAIVPNAPPKPRPPNPRPNPPRLPGDPVASGFGLPLRLPNGLPLGGVPLPPPLLPPNPPVGCVHPDVLVTDTLVAVMVVAAVPVLLLGAATATQSPFANDDSETADTFEN
jgi:hypothetical protein